MNLNDFSVTSLVLGAQMHKYQEFTTQQARLLEHKEGVVHLGDVSAMLNLYEEHRQTALGGHNRRNSHIQVLSAGSNLNFNANTAGAVADSEAGSTTNPSSPTNKRASEAVLSATLTHQLNSINISKMSDHHTNSHSSNDTNILAKILPSDEYYAQLTLAIDLFLSNKEQEKYSTFAKENAENTHNLFELITTATQSKEKREVGIKTTTDVKQFILGNMFNTAASKLGYTVGSTMVGEDDVSLEEEDS